MIHAHMAASCLTDPTLDATYPHSFIFIELFQGTDGRNLTMQKLGSYNQCNYDPQTILFGNTAIWNTEKIVMQQKIRDLLLQLFHVTGTNLAA